MNQTRVPAPVVSIEDMRFLSLSGGYDQPIGSEHHMIYALEGRAIFRSPLFDGIMNEGDMIVLPSGPGAFSISPVTEPTSVYYIRFASAHAVRHIGGWSIEDASPAVRGIALIQPMPVIRHRLEQLHRILTRCPVYTTALHIGWLKLWETIRKGLIAEEPSLSSLSSAPIYKLQTKNLRTT